MLAVTARGLLSRESHDVSGRVEQTHAGGNSGWTTGKKSRLAFERTISYWSLSSMCFPLKKMPNRSPWPSKVDALSASTQTERPPARVDLWIRPTDPGSKLLPESTAMGLDDGSMLQCRG